VAGPEDGGQARAKAQVGKGVDPRLRREVERRLLEHWSPQQIAACLVCDYPDDLEMRGVNETIYRSLFVRARGGAAQGTDGISAHRRTQRIPMKRTEHSGLGRLLNMVLISERKTSTCLGRRGGRS